ncbi:hypothetical protein AAE038_11345 [Bacillus velezensis]|uniref:hypothetical protein n=1 Tax=Bacillus velezensis TaxID=492670 RepID=UPI0031357EC5
MKNDILLPNKIKVFISSRCGQGFERYDEVRKQLKKLIESTKIADVYLFEESGASTQSAEQDYLYALDDSDVCLFLIDNKDDVTSAIVREITRAKSHPKKSIYLFCNEKESKPTQIQEELIGAKGAKYYIVNSFNEFANQGFKDLITDICNIYRHYCKNRLIDQEFHNSEQNKIEIGSIASESLEKRILQGIDKSKAYIGKKIFSVNKEVKETSELDRFYEQFLKVLFGEKSIEEFNGDLFLEQIKKEQSDNMHLVVKLRWKAIQFYWLDDFDSVLKYLKEAFDLCKESGLPDWISQDILIDLINIENQKLNQENKFSSRNAAQQELESMRQSLFYPSIDRYEKLLYKEINKASTKKKTETVYTVNLGSNLDVYIKYLTNIYIVAAFNGSLTQLLLLRNKIKDISFQLCEEYSNWEFRVLLLKMAVIVGDSKQTENIISYFNSILGKINYIDVKNIYNFTNCLPVKSERIKSKLEVFKHLGYYFSDEDYMCIKRELLEEIHNYIDNTFIVSMGKLIFDSLKENINRIEADEISRVCIKILEKKMFRFYDDALNLIGIISFKGISTQNLEKIKNLLKGIILDSNLANQCHNLLYAIINLRKQIIAGTSELNQVVLSNMSESDRKIYNLETSSVKRESHIMSYVQEIKEQIEKQGKNGIYSVKAQNPYLIIQNIIKGGCEIVDNYLLNEVLQVCNESLCATNLLYSDKVSALQLTIYIKQNFENIDYNFKDLYQYLIKHENHLFEGKDDLFQKYSTLTVKINYFMLKMVCCQLDNVDLLNLLSEINNEDEFEKIQCLKAIINAINNESFKNIESDIRSIIIQFTLSLKNDKNQDIRYLSIKALLKMITTKTQKVILTQLSQSMDYENVYIKNLIIGNFEKLAIIDSKVNNLILKKASIDNHYLVRTEAQKYIQTRAINITQ